MEIAILIISVIVLILMLLLLLMQVVILFDIDSIMKAMNSKLKHESERERHADGNEKAQIVGFKSAKEETKK